MPNRRYVPALAAVIIAASCAQKEEVVVPPTINVVSMTARDYAFEAPDSIPAGMTTFKLSNAGKTYHHALLVRLDSGKTLADAQAALKNPGPPPAWFVMVGGANAPDPGMESNATFDVAPGSYLLICIVDSPGRVPHVAHGMMRPLTVTAATGPSAPPPTADTKITLADYSFTVSQPITAGTHTFEVVTAPGQPHEIEILRLADGKTLDDLMTWGGGKMETLAPGTAIGGAIVPIPGAPAYFTADFAPGNYVMLCFIPDAKDGQPHVAHGMALPFTVQ